MATTSAVAPNFVFGAIAALSTLSASRTAHAEGLAEREAHAESIEHTVIIGVGGAAEVELGDGSIHPGGNLMIEWDAIEDWLELELGASVLRADGGVQVPVDLLFKKPFRLARWSEFMIGIGPELVQLTGATKGTYFGGEAALDFMFWPWGRRVGLWVEPEYDFVLRSGVSHGLGTTAGLLLGW
jgi:hypothetical protein